MTDKGREQGELSLVGAGTTIEGKIKTEGSVRVDGVLIGEIVAKMNAAVGASGSVEGTVTARNVSVSGKVKGMLTAGEKLVLESKSVVRGDIRAARLVIDEGAVFDGRCAMTQQPEQQASEKRPTPLSVATRQGTQPSS